MLIYVLGIFCLKIPSITKKLDYNGSLNGLIRKLQQNYTQIENSGIFEISASSVYKDWYPKNVLYDDNNGFHTGNNGSSGEYLQFDFKENFISLSSYTIKSRIDCCQSKSWKVNASINGIQWIIIDEVIEDISMCNNSITKSFFINNNNNFRYIRFISTTQRCSIYNYFNVISIEFFGSINKLISSNYKKRTLKNIIFNLLFLLI